MIEKMKNNKHFPKIIVLTLPLRDQPTYFPPLGGLSVVTVLKNAGFENTHFYNLVRAVIKSIVCLDNGHFDSAYGTDFGRRQCRSYR